MPVNHFSHTPAPSKFAVWSIDEEENQLMSQSYLTDNELNELSEITHPQKRLEFLAGKLCVKLLVNKTSYNYYGIIKDEFGKPHLIDQSIHISISHSFPLACAILDLQKPVGIDLEKPKSNLMTIAPKFLNEKEFVNADMDLDRLCILWSAKEAIYKEYGRKKLIFKDNIEIEPFEMTDEVQLKGKLIMNGIIKYYDLRIEKINDHIICYTL
jgi:4'-phosphopantetheinyl transferase